MKMISQEMQDLAIKSLQSTYHKLSVAYERMTEKGTNTTLVKKRKDAVKIGLDSLHNVWNKAAFPYEEEDIFEAKTVLHSLLPSIEKQLAKAKEGSSQNTLNERRLLALQLAIESLEERLTQ